MEQTTEFLRFEPVETSLMVHCEARVAPHQLDMADCKDRIASVLTTHQCTEVVFGLEKVQILSSRFLGLMASVHQLGVPVWVDSPAPQIVDLLKLTRYDALIKVREPVA